MGKQGKQRMKKQIIEKGSKDINKEGIRHAEKSRN
jgi:hypothetical protein